MPAKTRSKKAVPEKEMTPSVPGAKNGYKKCGPPEKKKSSRVPVPINSKNKKCDSRSVVEKNNHGLAAQAKNKKSAGDLNAEKRNPSVEVVTWTRRNTKCNFCKLAEQDEQKYGPMYKCGTITLHFFCLSFSSGIITTGALSLSDGIFGRDASTIRKELKQVLPLICIYCGKGGAYVKCSDNECARCFHLPCAWTDNLLIQFGKEREGEIRGCRALCNVHIEAYEKNGDSRDWIRCPLNYAETRKLYDSGAAEHTNSDACNDANNTAMSEKDRFLNLFGLQSSPQFQPQPELPIEVRVPVDVDVPNEEQSTVASPVTEVSLPSNTFYLKFMTPETAEELIAPATPVPVPMNTKIEPAADLRASEYSDDMSAESLLDPCETEFGLAVRQDDNPSKDLDSLEEHNSNVGDTTVSSVVGLDSCYDNAEMGESLMPSDFGGIEPLDSLETYGDFNHDGEDELNHNDNAYEDIKQTGAWSGSHKGERSTIFGLSSCFDGSDRPDPDASHPTIISVNQSANANLILTPFLGGNSTPSDRRQEINEEENDPTSEDSEIDSSDRETSTIRAPDESDTSQAMELPTMSMSLSSEEYPDSIFPAFLSGGSEHSTDIQQASTVEQQPQVPISQENTLTTTDSQDKGHTTLQSPTLVQSTSSDTGSVSSAANHDDERDELFASPVPASTNEHTEFIDTQIVEPVTVVLQATEQENPTKREELLASPVAASTTEHAELTDTQIVEPVTVAFEAMEQETPNERSELLASPVAASTTEHAELIDTQIIESVTVTLEAMEQETPNELLASPVAASTTEHAELIDTQIIESVTVTLEIMEQENPNERSELFASPVAASTTEHAEFIDTQIIEPVTVTLEAMEQENPNERSVASPVAASTIEHAELIDTQIIEPVTVTLEAMEQENPNERSELFASPVAASTTEHAELIGIQIIEPVTVTLEAMEQENPTKRDELLASLVPASTTEHAELIDIDTQIIEPVTVTLEDMEQENPTERSELFASPVEASPTEHAELIGTQIIEPVTVTLEAMEQENPNERSEPFASPGAISTAETAHAKLIEPVTGALQAMEQENPEIFQRVPTENPVVDQASGSNEVSSFSNLCLHTCINLHRNPESHSENAGFVQEVEDSSIEPSEVHIPVVVSEPQKITPEGEERVEAAAIYINESSPLQNTEEAAGIERDSESDVSSVVSYVRGENPGHVLDFERNSRTEVDHLGTGNIATEAQPLEPPNNVPTPLDDVSDVPFTFPEYDELNEWTPDPLPKDEDIDNDAVESCVCCSESEKFKHGSDITPLALSGTPGSTVVDRGQGRTGTIFNWNTLVSLSRVQPGLELPCLLPDDYPGAVLESPDQDDKRSTAGTVQSVGSSFSSKKRKRRKEKHHRNKKKARRS